MRIRRLITITILGVAVAVFGYLTSQTVPAQPGQGDGGDLDADAARLLSRIGHKVIETGYVESESSVELRSELDEPTTILSVVAEGAQVKKGDLVVELDASGLESQLAQRTTTLAAAEAKLRMAQEELSTAKELQTILADADEIRLAIAVRRQENYLADNGPYKTQAEALKREIDLAGEQLAIATQELKRLEKMVAAKTVDSQIADARLELSAARVRIAVTESKLRLLEQHEKPDELETRKLAVLEAKAQLIRSSGELSKRVRVASSQVAAAEAAVQLDRHTIENLNRQIAACRIHSPQDGIVIHANQFSSRGSAEFAVEAGATVRPRQRIIQLPDMSRLQLRVAVNETKIAKVRPGQPVVIQLDALADVKLQGRVSHVNQYPEPMGFFSEGVKQYGVLVSIIDPPTSIRLGMTAFAEIDVTAEAEIRGQRR